MCSLLISLIQRTSFLSMLLQKEVVFTLVQLIARTIHLVYFCFFSLTKEYLLFCMFMGSSVVKLFNAVSISRSCFLIDPCFINSFTFS